MNGSAPRVQLYNLQIYKTIGRYRKIHASTNPSILPGQTCQDNRTGTLSLEEVSLPIQWSVFFAGQNLVNELKMVSHFACEIFVGILPNFKGSLISFVFGRHTVMTIRLI